MRKAICSVRNFQLLFFCVTIFLFCSGTVYAFDRRVDKSRLSIMTFNAQYLWDGVEPEKGEETFPWKSSKTKAEEHMKMVAGVIKANNPDIVNIVEVENLRALAIFNNKYLKSSNYRPFLVKGKEYSIGQNVALLTRVDPINNAIKRGNKKDSDGVEVLKLLSENYFVKIKIANYKIAIIGLHLLLDVNEKDRIQLKESQAGAIADLVTGFQDEGYQPIVLGSFNEYDGEEGFRDHIDSKPISNALKIVKQMKQDNVGDDLFNVASLVPKNSRYTAFYDKNKNGLLDNPDESVSIDHILISQKLKDLIEKVEIPHEHDPTKVSDHFPVIVHLKFVEGGKVSLTKGVRVISLIPNPSGDESLKEQITIKNFSDASINLEGWRLKNIAGGIWYIGDVGVLEPGMEKVVKKEGQSMELSNNGDIIDLVNHMGKVVQTINYPHTEEDKVIVIKAE